MDLESGIVATDNLTSENKQLRWSLYLKFANTRSLQNLYSNIVTKLKKYIDENLLSPNCDEDILFAIFNENKGIKYEPTMKEMVKTELKLRVYFLPLFPAVNIALSLKRSHQVIAKMDKIGYQHLYTLSNMLDTSETSEAADTSDSERGTTYRPPLKKKLRKCQRAIEIDCESMLKYHRKNLTQITGTTVHVDVLIFIDKSVCVQLSEYLGLVYVEDLLVEAGENDMDSVLFRLKNKNAQLYTLIQTFINKKLVKGSNNVCLVHTLELWENVCANVRALVSNKNDKLLYLEPAETANFHVDLGHNPTLLSYVEAVTNVIDSALSFESHVVAKYQSSKDSYYNVKLSLISVVPLYVLKYFTQCEIRMQKYKSN